MFDRFTQEHKMHNLIWIYTADPAHHEWYPGDDMVDVVGAGIEPLDIPACTLAYRTLAYTLAYTLA
jgi:hypothetical protein